MKKFLFTFVVWIVVILSWCTFIDNIIGQGINIIGQEDTNIKNNITEDSYNPEAKFPMEKPSSERMNNFDAIINWYVKNWEMDYVLTNKNIQYLDKGCSKIIVQWWSKHTRYSNSFNPSIADVVIPPEYPDPSPIG